MSELNPDLNGDRWQRCTDYNSPAVNMHLLHDGVLWVSGLHDGRLHKVALPVITVTSSDDF